jgi:hypothetical protein
MASQSPLARSAFEAPYNALSPADRTKARLRSGNALPRIAFLFNAQAHQLLHGITIAEALARDWRCAVDILSASATHLDLACALAQPGTTLRFSRIGSPWLHRLAARSASGLPPKLLTLAAARRGLNRYDAIAVPERTSTILRKFGVTRPKWLHLDHGAGDRAAGFDPRIARFDFALVAGEKQRRRMLAAGLIRPGAHAVVGYAKFDAAARLRDSVWRPFANARPIILYNPHFSAKLGSWPRHGLDIVRRIAADGRFNLIVAPHVRLCDGRRARAAMIETLSPFADLPHVHVDLGSDRSIDMTYTTMADLYLGDVSSQIYEYLRAARPCLFVNGDGRDWRDDPDYTHWHYGPVIGGGASIIAGIEQAFATHAAYLPAQRKAFADTFGPPGGESASDRGAAAIANFLHLRPR